MALSPAAHSPPDQEVSSRRQDQTIPCEPAAPGDMGRGNPVSSEFPAKVPSPGPLACLMKRHTPQTPPMGRTMSRAQNSSAHAFVAGNPAWAYQVALV